METVKVEWRRAWVARQGAGSGYESVVEDDLGAPWLSRWRVSRCKGSEEGLQQDNHGDTHRGLE